MERDARQSLAAVAKPLSPVAARDLLWPEGGHGESTRLLEYFLEGEETVFEISSMDARDERAHRFRKDILMQDCGFLQVLILVGFTFI